MSIRGQVWAAQAEAATEFGSMLRRWRERMGWTQYTAIEWAAQAEAPFASMPHSGLSELENGKTKHPRAPLFLYLGEMNSRIAVKDYKGVHARKVIDALKGSIPILDEHGEPWGPEQFWACFAGIRAIPDWLQPVPLTPVPELTQDAACDLGDGWREEVLRIGAAAGLRPLAAVGQFIRTCPAIARDALEDGFAGGFSPSLVGACWDPEAAEWGPVQWIAEWAQALAGRNASHSGGGSRSSELRHCGSA